MLLKKLTSVHRDALKGKPLLMKLLCRFKHVWFFKENNLYVIYKWKGYRSNFLRLKVNA